MLPISSLLHATFRLFHFNQSPQIPTTMHDERHERILRMLKHSVLAKLPSTSISPISGATTVIQLEQLMQKVFPQSFHTPTHPTYAFMILRAIDELKEQKGSSEVAISAFIKREYNDLPWGHESFLSHHLRKLSRNGDIQCTMGGRFMLQSQIQQELQQTAVCNKLLEGGTEDGEEPVSAPIMELREETGVVSAEIIAEEGWKLKRGPDGESKYDTLTIEGHLRQRREDLAEEKHRQQGHKIDVRLRTTEFCYDDVEGVKVPPVMIEEKLHRHKLQNGSLSLYKQQDQKMVVKPQILLSLQDDEECGLSLNILEKALASSPRLQEENLEQSQLNQPYCVDDGSVVPALNQLQQIHICERNESDIRQNDLSAYTELHVDAEKEKYSSSKILPKQGTEFNLNAIASCSSNAKQHLDQQPPKRGRGRPHKIISDVETTSEASSQSHHCKFYNGEESHLPRGRERGLPRKLIADAEETTSEKAAMVSSESCYYKFYNDEESQLPKCRGEGRPRKLISDEGKPTVVPSQSYHYKFYNLEETLLPQIRERGRPCKSISDVGKTTVVSSHSYHYKFYNHEETRLP